jgi:poly-beta-1,6-N-acetyl-D-glucosamine synthase
MIEAIEWIWFFCLLVLTGYYMIVFRKPKFPQPLQYTDWPGVSIVIAHQNDIRHLEKNLDAIHSQDYPLFEILIIDDHSSEEQKILLDDLNEKFPRVKMLANDHHGKKNAISKAIQLAAHDLILCTDADCRPASDQWIKKMVLSGRGAKVVLGYSPYHRMKSWLNRLIRFETVMTAIQYLSWAAAGKPYMGVGRNMLYHRSLFLELDPYKAQTKIPFGDDDLWIQTAAQHARVKICDDPQAHAISEPPSTWKEWLNQKHRHLSAGHHYKNALWWQPGLFGIMMFTHWFLIPFLVAGSNWWKWLPVLLIALMIRWSRYSNWTKQLGEKDTIWWYPFLEINYAFYLGAMGTFTIFQKKKTWTR